MRQPRHRNPRESLPWNQPDAPPPPKRTRGAVLLLLVLALVALRFGIAGPIAPLDTLRMVNLWRPTGAQDAPPAVEQTEETPSGAMGSISQSWATPHVEPTSEVFRLAVARDVYEALEDAIVLVAQAHRSLIVLPYADAPPIATVLEDGLADGALSWSTEPITGAIPLREEPYVAVFHPSLARELTRKQLADLAAGHDQTYRIVAPVSQPQVAELFGLHHLGEADSVWYPTEVDDWEAAKEYVATHEDAWAVLPWEAVDFRVHPVLVDGQAFDPHKPGAYPLVRRLWLQTSRPMPTAELEALQAALRYQPLPPLELIVVGGSMAQNDAGIFVAEPEVEMLISNADLALSSVPCARIDATSADSLAAAGFDALSLASDRREACDGSTLLAARELLQTAGIVAVGAGETALEARRPSIVDMGDLHVALLAYHQPPSNAVYASETTPGVATLLGEHLAGDIAAGRGRADFVVVFIHWSAEEGAAENAVRQETVRTLCQAGATLVLGQDNAARGFTYETDCLALDGMSAYGVGGAPAESYGGLVLRALLDETGLKHVELIPHSVADSRLALLPAEETELVLQEIAHLTHDLGGYPQTPQVP